MPRSSFRSVAAVTLVSALLIYVGCTKTYETTTPATVSASTTAEPAPSTDPIKPSVPARSTTQPETPSKPSTSSTKDPLSLFADWSANPPTAVLVISGEQDGYLQPCGCTDGQLGGLGRRYHLIEHLKAKGWPVAAIDLGNLIHDPAGSRGGPEQAKIKFDIALQALTSMKYDAVALGPEDLKLGIFQTLGVLMNLKEPRFLAANLKPADEFKDTIRPSSLIQDGKVVIGVTAVLDPADFNNLADPDKVLLNLQAPDEVLPAILAQLEKASAFQVLLVQGSVEEGKRLAEKFPGFDMVVSRSTFEDPDERATELNAGKTLLINVGKKGKYAGVVGLFPGATPSVRYRRQALDATHFREAEPMRKLIDEDYQKFLRQAGVVENLARTSNSAFAAGASYVGAASCKGCHPKTFEKWASTKHARAYEPLMNVKRNREYDAECITCHTTGFPYKTGWVSAEKTPNLRGNQCENCHGPGSLHNADPDNMEYRKQPMAMTAQWAESSGFCNKCHDLDNDPHFKFSERYPQIYHKGLDTYDDPKVHVKSAKVALDGK